MRTGACAPTGSASVEARRTVNASLCLRTAMSSPQMNTDAPIEAHSVYRRAYEKVRNSRQKPPRPLLHDRVFQPPFGFGVRVDCESLLQQALELRAILFGKADRFRVGNIGRCRLTSGDLD